MGEAADRYAGITRDQWANYKTSGVPIENKLLGMIDNKATLGQNLANATDLINTSSNVAASETVRGLSQYGINQTSAQQLVNNRLSNLSRTAGLADARNYVRQDAQDLNSIILSGAPNSGLDTIGR